eukprot:1501800-Rhodomonas_salina.1
MRPPSLAQPPGPSLLQLSRARAPARAPARASLHTLRAHCPSPSPHGRSPPARAVPLPTLQAAFAAAPFPAAPLASG